jgi:hypothetical protein
MIKWIFGLLFMANVLFFAVMQWGSALTVDTGNPQAQAPLNADKIKIVAMPVASSAVPASAVIAASAVSATSSGAAATSAPSVAKVVANSQFSCMEWGEFSGADLQRVNNLITSMTLGYKTKQRTVEHITGYWVYIAPIKSTALVAKKVAQLKKMDIKDYFVVKESGTWKNSISLGIFKTEDAAKKYLATLQEQGVRSAKVGERASKLKFSIFVMNRLDGAQAAQVASLHKDFPESELKSVPCN